MYAYSCLQIVCKYVRTYLLHVNYFIYTIQVYVCDSMQTIVCKQYAFIYMYFNNICISLYFNIIIQLYTT